MTQNIGFGIVGSGLAAYYHKIAIESNFELGARLKAVAGRDENKFQAACEEFGVPCMTYNDMLNKSDVDVVCICTPSGLHAEQALAAAEADKHVLVEKPMAISVADADAMIKTFEEKGLFLGVAYQRRAEARYREVYQIVESGGIGDITSALVTIPYQRTMEYYDSAPWRGTWRLDGGGVLMNQGIHLIDLLVWYAGDPVEVKAIGGTLLHNIEVEDTLSACLRFENGAMATVAATTTTTPGYPHRLEIYGKKGGIQVEGEAIIRRYTMVDPPENLTYSSSKQVDAGSGADPKGIKADGHIGLIANFFRAIRGDETLLVGGREGRRSLKLVMEIYKQAGLRY